MIKDDLALLHELQQVDSAIDQREAVLAGIDDGSAAAQELEAAQAALDEADEQLRHLQTRHRDLELQLKGIDEEKKEKSDRAYGGTVSDPRELTALERKLGELDRNTNRVEDLILGVLDEIEQAQALAAERTTARDEAAARAGNITSTFSTETERARTELEQLRARREELVPGLSPALLKQYDQMRERLSGVAIVAVEGSLCGACHVAVYGVNLDRLRRGNAIVKCESCHRLLCLAPE